MSFLLQLFNYLFNKYKIINKIGVYVHEEYIYDIYINVLHQLDNDKFDIILEDKFIEARFELFRLKLTSNGWSIKFRKDIIWRYKYLYLITNSYVGGNVINPPSFFRRLLFSAYKISNKIFRLAHFKYQKKIDEQYFPKIIGVNNIRFMYGLDAGGTKFGDDNYLYDVFFCHGPRDASEVEDEFNKSVIQMGYPRYDKYFELKNNNKIDVIESLYSKFTCDRSKKTILWITTVYPEFSTIETYADTMKQLSMCFNIIVRPHPLEIDPTSNRFKQSVLNIVNDDCFIVADDFFQDMTELYLVADLVVADYGGTIFSALYLDKRILLLNNQKAEEISELVTSTSFEVRKYLPSIDAADAPNILQMMGNPKFWESTQIASEKTRTYYFGDLRGNSSKRVSTYLNQLKLDSSSDI